MNTREVAWGPSVVPSTGANEMHLHELVAHIERDHTMTRGYVVKANGWVDPSTLACHRYVVLTIEHRSESGALVGLYYIRIDRRAERHLPALKFVRQLGRVKSSDRVRYHTDLQIQTLTARDFRLYCHMTRIDYWHPVRRNRRKARCDWISRSVWIGWA